MNSNRIDYDLQMSDKIMTKIKSILRQNSHSYLKYPWENLEDLLFNQGKETCQIIAYGSLINAKSAALTISAKGTIPVLSFGVYRKFNYSIPQDNTRYGKAKNNKNRAALNVEITYDPKDFINGLLLEIPISEISALRNRETAYDLVQVPSILWNNRNIEPFNAFILHCPYKEFQGVERTNNDLEPHIEYFKVCKEGAKSFGNEFLKCWRATSFLADGKTSINTWEQNG